ncbi:uncharacterized protein LOC142230629 [Haematobia irritans]|uniref:uncharacterized protein LOC142230629 n=1 Tax=Haematobia irritans TaxID=7368 RepID=UPI003F4FB15F
MVWDAPTKSNGVCLNDYMHSGSDLLKPFVNVLLSFRVGKVAVCGDIADMFHQITIGENDMQTQRFLWWDKNDLPGKLSVYVMCSLTFGISCKEAIELASQVKSIHAAAGFHIRNWSSNNDAVTNYFEVITSA